MRLRLQHFTMLGLGLIFEVFLGTRAARPAPPLTLISVTCLFAAAHKVEDIASGDTTVMQIANHSFRRWTSALSLIRVVERPVEGLHSRVSHTLKRAPNATLSLISNELRFNSFCKLLLSWPQAWFFCFALVCKLKASTYSGGFSLLRSVIVWFVTWRTRCFLCVLLLGRGVERGTCVTQAQIQLYKCVLTGPFYFKIMLNTRVTRGVACVFRCVASY